MNHFNSSITRDRDTRIRLRSSLIAMALIPQENFLSKLSICNTTHCINYCEVLICNIHIKIKFLEVALHNKSTRHFASLFYNKQAGQGNVDFWMKHCFLWQCRKNMQHPHSKTATVLGWIFTASCHIIVPQQHSYALSWKILPTFGIAVQAYRYSLCCG